jgi:hypothetical protein
MTAIARFGVVPIVGLERLQMVILLAHVLMAYRKEPALLKNYFE